MTTWTKQELIAEPTWGGLKRRPRESRVIGLCWGPISWIEDGRSEARKTEDREKERIVER